jgi:hypothetical protein
MTFAIQEVFEEINLSSESYLFDIEGFNWVLNRNTYFTNNDGLVMQQDFKKTDFMLKSFENVDPDLLEIIHYIDSDQKMPIHYALMTNNTRVVNVILNYMSKIDYASIHHITDIISDLINYK